jgi:ParB-like chromosome segregation protein Spo0J
MADDIEFIDAKLLSANSDQQGELDDDNVAKLVAAIRRGDAIPPVIARRDWMEVRDGCHRLAAAKIVGVKLPVLFVDPAEIPQVKRESECGDEGLTEAYCTPGERYTCQPL